MLTLSFLFIVLLDVFFYPFKKLGIRGILLYDFFFGYNFNFYVSLTQIKHISVSALFYLVRFIFVIFFKG